MPEKACKYFMICPAIADLIKENFEAGSYLNRYCLNQKESEQGCVAYPMMAPIIGEMKKFIIEEAKRIRERVGRDFSSLEEYLEALDEESFILQWGRLNLVYLFGKEVYKKPNYLTVIANMKEKIKTKSSSLKNY